MAEPLLHLLDVLAAGDVLARGVSEPGQGQALAEWLISTEGLGFGAPGPGAGEAREDPEKR